MAIDNLKDTKALLNDIDNFLTNPNFSPKNQNKWFFSDGLSYYEQLCEILKLLTYFQQAFKSVESNEESLQSALNEVNTKIAEFEESIGTLPSDVANLKTEVSTLSAQINAQLIKITENSNAIKDLQVDNETNELNIANNASEITKLKEKDFLTSVTMENSATVTWTGGIKEDGIQTYSAQVTGSIPANLTENLAFANNNVTPIVHYIGSADVIEQDAYIASAISMQNINNGKSNTATIPVAKFDKSNFSKNSNNIIGINPTLLEPYETKANANATFATNDELNAVSSAKQDKLTFDTQWFSVSNDNVTLKDSVFDDYLTKDDAPGYADILTQTDASTTYATKTDMTNAINSAIGTAINSLY